MTTTESEGADLEGGPVGGKGSVRMFQIAPLSDGRLGGGQVGIWRCIECADGSFLVAGLTGVTKK